MLYRYLSAYNCTNFITFALLFPGEKKMFTLTVPSAASSTTSLYAKHIIRQRLFTGGRRCEAGPS